MRGITRRVFLTAAASTSLSSRTPSFSTGRPAESVQTWIDQERQSIRDVMVRARVEGVAVCLIYDGHPTWIEGFGVTDSPNGDSVGRSTIFSIQSTSKNVTAVAIMIAVERGLLELDAPINTYLPDFTVRTRFAPRPEAQITLRLLLSHRAGFTHEAPVGNNYIPAFLSFEEHVRSISQTWLRYPVGERYRYSNLGYDLAGYILQARSGMPFAEWVREELLRPLGMIDSTFSPEDYSASHNRAVGHQEGYATVPLRTPLIPSGGFYTSVRDFAAYSLFHLDHGKLNGRQLLSEKLWSEMHGFALGGDYGLGVIRLERRYGETPLRLLSHKGGGFGFGSIYVYCPEARFALAAFFNRPADACYQFGETLVNRLLERQCGPRRPRLPVEDLAPISPARLQRTRWAGRYVGRNSLVTLSEKDGALYKEAESVSPLALLSPDEAVIIDPQGEAVSYRYVVGQHGLPDHLECSIGEESLDQNDGSGLARGPAKKEWSRYTGNYQVDQWGKPSIEVILHLRHGYLYLNETRLIAEMECGLFVTTDGEIVDLRGSTPTWKSLVLSRRTAR